LHLLTIIRERYPSKEIYFSGFSLGGNVVLKLLGELGDRAKEMRIKGCAVTCVPFDPVQSQIKLDVGFNRAVYSENFLQTLKKKAEQQILLFPGAFDIEAIRACKTIGDFDEAFIAKIYGFADKVTNKKKI
jgi:predicted alpha/beta-fold hydrolase